MVGAVLGPVDGSGDASVVGREFGTVDQVAGCCDDSEGMGTGVGVHADDKWVRMRHHSHSGEPFFQQMNGLAANGWHRSGGNHVEAIL